MAIPSEVKPGQLITAAFMNDILAELADIRAQLANLPGSATAGLAILSLVPSGGSSDPIVVGSELRILGQDFRYTAGGHRVYFDGLQVNSFKTGSSDTILIIDVPQPPGPTLPSAGRGVVLRVENGLAAVNRVVTIRPAQATPQGGVDVTWRDDAPNPVPNPIAAGTTASFGYRIRSLASLSAEFVVGVVTNPVSFQALATVEDTNGTPIANNRVALEPGATKDIVVRMALPAGSDGQAFSLNVSATVPGAGSGFQSGSDSRGFVVGAAAEEQDATIDLGSPVFLAVDTAGAAVPGASFDAGTNTITLPAGALGAMEFTAIFELAGSYNLEVTLPAGASGWEHAQVPASLVETAPNQSESVRFTLQPSAAATTPIDVAYRVRNADGPPNGQVRRFSVVRV